MADKLKNPSGNKQQQSPAPIEEEEWQRDDNHRNAEAVRQAVQRMPVLGFVVSQKIVRHELWPVAGWQSNNLDKDIHRAAAYHSFFTRFISRE